MVQNSPNRLTALNILICLRQRLLAAIEQNNKGEFQDLAAVFGMLWDVVDTCNVQGGIDLVIENFRNTSSDYYLGIGWKGIIPSEEEIRVALGEEA